MTWEHLATSFLFLALLVLLSVPAAIAVVLIARALPEKVTDFVRRWLELLAPLVLVAVVLAVAGYMLLA